MLLWIGFSLRPGIVKLQRKVAIDYHAQQQATSDSWATLPVGMSGVGFGIIILASTYAFVQRSKHRKMDYEELTMI